MRQTDRDTEATDAPTDYDPREEPDASDYGALVASFLADLTPPTGARLPAVPRHVFAADLRHLAYTLLAVDEIGFPDIALVQRCFDTYGAEWVLAALGDAYREATIQRTR